MECVDQNSHPPPTWDLDADLALREALIELLAQALAAQVNRPGPEVNAASEITGK